jgi:alkaline phosphatase D
MNRRWTLLLLGWALLPGAWAEPPGDILTWCGAVTPTSAVVKVWCPAPVDDARLVLSRAEDLSGAVRVSPAGTGNLLTFAPAELSPATRYFYALERGGTVPAEGAGSLETFPTGPASFAFVFGSCAHSHDQPVFETMAKHEPLFYLNLGDLHYRDIATNDVAAYQRAYQAVFAAPLARALFRRTPFVYMWDDHDYGPNDSDARSPGRAAAQRAYRAWAPHYALPAGDGDHAIYQAFTVGRVRFILTDLRSERSPARQPDEAAKTMLGAQQKAWFKDELRAARDRYPLVFWVSSVTWTAKPSPGDNWGSYSTERRELAEFIKEIGLRQLCVLAGDAHCTAADDGRSGDYATGGGAPVPEWMSSPLDAPGSFKGGPFSEGVYVPARNEGLFGLVTVHDDGRQITATFSGRNQRDEEKVRHQLQFP